MANRGAQGSALSRALYVFILEEAPINSKMSISEEIFFRSEAKSAGNTLCIAEHFCLAHGEN